MAQSLILLFLIVMGCYDVGAIERVHSAKEGVSEAMNDQGHPTIANKAVPASVEDPSQADADNILLYPSYAAKKAVPEDPSQADADNVLFYRSYAAKKAVPASVEDPSHDADNVLFYPSYVAKKAVPASVEDPSQADADNFLLYPYAAKKAVPASVEDPSHDADNVLFYPSYVAKKAVPASVEDPSQADADNFLFYPYAAKKAVPASVEDPSHDADNVLFYPSYVAKKAVPASVEDPSHDADNVLFYPSYVAKKAVPASVEDPSQADADNVLFYPSYAARPKAPSTMDHDATHNAAQNMHHQKGALLFFRMNTLKVGGEVVIPSLASHALGGRKLMTPRLEAMLGSMELPRLLSVLKIPLDSTLARKSKTNLGNCRSPPLQGEKKACVSSIRSMTNFARSVLEDKKPLEHLNPSRPVSSPEHFKIMDVKVVTENSVVTCHPMVFPYALYMCHFVPKSVPIKVTLQDDHDKLVVVPVMCHMDTSEFDPSHLSFKILNTKPGEAEMCHWMPNSHIMWYTSDGKTRDVL
uniref:BURP n=1 Tax=Selaginella kraussiana TaxID=81964 RepID=A0A8F8FL01_9TRAC|nr:BURP [Selaginella kraussiana]